MSDLVPRNLYDQHSNLGRPESFQVHDPRFLILDCGSLFSYDEEADLNLAMEIMDHLRSVAQKPWRWMIDDRIIDKGSPPERHDIRREVWFHFDVKRDAMLTKMSFKDLRSANQFLPLRAA